VTAVRCDDLELDETFAREIGRSDALVIASWWAALPFFIDASVLDRALSLRVIAGSFDTRYSRVLDVDEVRRRGIRVIDTSRSMTPTVAEFAVAMTLNLIRDIPAAIDLVHRDRWGEGPAELPGFVYGDLSGRRIGLAGYGSINRRYHELIRGFECDVAVYDPLLAADRAAELGMTPTASLEELASRSEVFVVGIPPMPSTLQAISDGVLSALSPGSLVVVVTRMAVVDQEALWRQVEAGRIRVAVDVFDPEPPPAGHISRRHPNVLATPHIAGNAVYAQARCFTDACLDTVAVLGGAEPRFDVPDALVRQYAG
jgi:D-3-phosphoglycerate dehydrogenase